MTLEAKVTVRDGVVVLELSGEYRREEHRVHGEEIHEMVRELWTDESKPLRVLFDIRRLTGEIRRSSGYVNITREWGEAGVRKFAWLYADPANEPQFRYRETVARNHGYIARAFRDEDEAMKWLTDTGAKRAPRGY